MSTKPVSRRTALRTAGIAVGASVVTCAGLGFAATRAPRTDTPEFDVGAQNPAQNRVLIAYATRAGSTVEVAAAIGETLGTRGFAVDVKPVKANPPLDGYQTVLLGSAIRTGGWLPEAIEFIAANQQTLNRLPVLLFTVHGNNLGDDETSRTNRLAYLDAVRPLIRPVDEVFFAGKIDPSRLSLIERMMVQMVKSPVGDFRDWDAIHGWAQSVQV